MLRGLADDDARALLVATTPGRVDARVRDRIVAETRGNPLALLELPKGMTAAELAGGFPVPHPRDLPGQLEEHFLRRLEEFPEATQRLMLVAAADPTGDVALLWRAAQTLGIGREAAVAADAEATRRDRGDRCAFAIPWFARRSIRERLRRTAGLCIWPWPRAMDPRTDPDRRAWHRALAAAEPDEAVASELERSAGRAQSRGGLAAAAAFMQRSVALTADPQQRADRALAAAQAQVQAGAFDEALRMLGAAEIDAQDDLQRALVDLLRGQIASIAGPITEASAQLLIAARRLEPFDVGLARETYLDAWGAAFFTGQLGGSGQLREVSEAARAGPASPDPPRLPDLLLDGLSLLVTEGRAAATPILHQAVRAFPTEELSVERGLLWGGLAAIAAGALWDFDSMRAVMSRQTELARSAGALAPLCFTLVGDAYVATWCGDLAMAAALAAELNDLAEATGIYQVPSGAALLAAFAGDEPRSSTVIEAAIELATARGEGYAAQVGIGLIYDNVTGSIQSVRDRLLAWPSNSSLPLTFNILGQPLDTMTDIVPTLDSTNALPAVATPFNQFGWYYDTHLKNHYSTQYNLEIQKQINQSLVATVGYVGSFDRNLPVTGIANDFP